MSEKDEALAERLAAGRLAMVEQLTDEVDTLRRENERLHDELRQSSIDITRAEVERLKAENERLRDGLASDWAELKACRSRLREHLLEIERLREALQGIAEVDLTGCDLTAAGYIAHALIGRAKAALRREET